MALNDLRLRVILQALDQASAPLRRVRGASVETAHGLKETRNKLKELQQQQKSLNQFREVRTALQGASARLSQAQASVKGLAQQMAQADVPTKALAREFKAAKASAGALGTEFDRQRLLAQRLRDGLHAAGISTQGLGGHERRLRSEITATTAAMRTQEIALQRIADHQRRLDMARANHARGMVHAGMIGGAGYGMSTAGQRLGRGVVGAMRVGYDFDAQMSATQAVTRIAEKSDPRLQALRDQARTLPLSTKFTDSEVAQGQYYLARTGFAPEQVHAAMPGMLDMTAAAGGSIDLARAADISSNILTASGMDPSESNRVADGLTAAFVRTNVDLDMLGGSLKYSAGVAREYGQTFETNTAATAILGNAGIQDSMAGTAMRSVLTRLGNSAAVAKLGVNTKDEGGNMRDLVDILRDINDKTKDMGNLERGGLFKSIAGQYAVTAFGALMRATESGQLQDLRTIIENSKGEAARVARTQLDNLKGDMTMLHAALENISVELFDKNNPWLREFTQQLTNAMHWVGEFLKNNPTFTQGLVIVAAAFAVILTVLGGLAIAVAAVLGPLFIMQVLLAHVRFSPVIAGLKLLRTVIFAVGRALLMSPIGIAIALIAGAALLIYKFWEPISAFFTGIWAGFVAALQPVSEAFKAALGPMAPLLDEIRPAWDWFTGKLGEAWEWATKLFAPFKATEDQLKGATSAGEAFGWLLGTILADTLLLPAKFFTIGREMVTGLIDGIGSMYGFLKDKVLDLGSSSIGWFKEKLGIKSPSRIFMLAGNEIANGAAEGITERQQLVQKAAMGLATAATAALPMLAGAGVPPDQMAAMLPLVAELGAAPQVDARAPLGAAPGAAVSPAGMGAGGPGASNYTITINAAPGMDPQAIARAVSAELDKRERQGNSRTLSRLNDFD